MNLTAIGLCKQAILLITVVSCYGGKTFSTHAEQATSQKINSDSLKINVGEKYNTASVKTYSCRKTNPAYDDVYSFETENYYINICQIEDSFYYYRQSKSDINQNTLIPAYPVFGGKVFKAVDGKAIYFVGKDGNRHYSSTMLNNNEIVLEPELLPTEALFSQDIVDSKVDFSFAGIKLNSLDPIANVNWVVNSQENRQNNIDSFLCLEENSAVDPNLANWHSLLGKSPDIANDYATNNGHDFVYNRISPHQALIKTKEGSHINLNIAANSKVIKQVCVQPRKNI